MSDEAQTHEVALEAEENDAGAGFDIQPWWKFWWWR